MWCGVIRADREVNGGGHERSASIMYVCSMCFPPSVLVCDQAVWCLAGAPEWRGGRCQQQQRGCRWWGGGGAAAELDLPSTRPACPHNPSRQSHCIDRSCCASCVGIMRACARLEVEFLVRVCAHVPRRNDDTVTRSSHKCVCAQRASLWPAGLAGPAALHHHVVQLAAVEDDGEEVDLAVGLGLRLLSRGTADAEEEQRNGRRGADGETRAWG